MQLISLDADSTYEQPMGLGESRWGTVAVHVKTADNSGQRGAGGAQLMLAHEFIATRLAGALGLPVVSGEVVTLPDRNGTAWASLQVDAIEPTFPPTNPAELASIFPEVTAGIEVFDLWLGNTTRTEHNILFSPDVGAWVVGHEGCFADLDGETPAKEPSGFLPPPDPRCPHVKKWCARVQFFPSDTIEHIMQTAFSLRLLNAQTRNAYKKYLLNRRDRIQELVNTASPYGEVEANQPTLNFVGADE